MTTLPVSTAAPYRFTPLRDAIAKAREAVEDANLAHAEAAAKARETAAKTVAAPDDADLAAAAKAADHAEGAALEAVDAAETRLAALERDLEARPGQPVYRLRVPSYRSNSALQELLLELPAYPGDRPMFRAIKRAAADPDTDLAIDDPDLLRVEEALKTSGGGLPDALIDAFNDLFDRVSDHPEVRAVVRRRFRSRSDTQLAKVRFHLLGFERVSDIEGNPAPFTLGPDGLASDAAIDAIPPADVLAIAAKVDELGTLRGRVGESSASPSPSPMPPTTSPTTETPEAETMNAPAA